MIELMVLCIVVLILCFNEGIMIVIVVCDFVVVLLLVKVFVYDNNFIDDMVEVVCVVGVIVWCEFMQGKGYVVWWMFVDIDVDVYVMVDGDVIYEVVDVLVLVG